MNHSRDEIIGLLDRDLVIISHHARVRMFERNISTDDLFMARVGDEIIVIRDVPAFICDRCGEAYYSAEVSRKIIA